MSYVHQPFPSWRYHRDGSTCLIHSHAEHESLGSGWASTPAAFDVPAEIEIEIEPEIEIAEAPKKRKR